MAQPFFNATLEQLGSYSGVLVLILLIASSLVRNADALAKVSGAMVAAALLLGVLGYVFGALGARVAGLTMPQRRAVAFETSIQNSPLAFGIILASFPSGEERLLWMPMLYALLVLLSASAITLTIRWLGGRPQALGQSHA